MSKRWEIFALMEMGYGDLTIITIGTEKDWKFWRRRRERVGGEGNDDEKGEMNILGS
jgi:hypothetical protein